MQPYAEVRDRIEAARQIAGGDMQVDKKGAASMAIAYAPPLVEMAVLIAFEEGEDMVPSRAALNPLNVSYIVEYGS